MAHFAVPLILQFHHTPKQACRPQNADSTADGKRTMPESARSRPVAKYSSLYSWTCKVKHRKCDRARPACGSCDERGVLCEGYEVRLRWGLGVASRGRFTGAEAPTVASVSVAPRVNGRLRDRARGGQRQLQSAAASRAGSSPSTEADQGMQHPPCLRLQSVHCR
jgi:hypothetical protein